jgi:hypothetical protein
MIYAIVNAFCPTVQLARTLIEYDNNPLVDKLIIVNSHYPSRHYEKNQTDFRILMDSYCHIHSKCTVLDPGQDLGSAQAQNYALDEFAVELDEENSYFINLDPDAACRAKGDPILGDNWISAAKRVLDSDFQLAVVSCNAPMVENFISTRHQNMEIKEVAGIRLMLPDVPTPFNLSMWRYSFIKSIGGIPQKFPYYGEVEGPVFGLTRAHGFYNAYLKDYMEDEQGKLMHDRAFEDWKDAHARENTFLGNFKEYIEQNNLL